MKKTTQALWAFLLFCAVVLLEQFTGLDAAVQNHFFDFASGLWLVDEERNPVMHFLLYDGIKILLVVLAVAAAGVLAASFKKPVLKKLRYGCILFLLAMAFIPLVIAGAKKATNVYCPYQVTLYDGENPYVKVLSRYPPDYDFTVHKRGHCFPAGHASGGFALMILFFCFKKKKYKIAGLCLGLAAALGHGAVSDVAGGTFPFAYTVHPVCRVADVPAAGRVYGTCAKKVSGIFCLLRAKII